MNLSFYQSGDVIYTPVDFTNPQHRTLVEMILTDKTPSPKANKLMKSLGFQASEDDYGRTVWSSDLWLWHPEKLHNHRAFKDDVLEYLSTF